MLKRENRLTTKFEINVTRKYGRNIPGQYFFLYALLARNYRGPAKVAIIVSNKFSKSAVKRNRIKRVFREAVRQNFDKIPQDHWLIVYPKFSSAVKTYEEISFDVSKTLQKIPLPR